MWKLEKYDTLCLQNQIQNNSGAGHKGPVKREVDANPTRTRRCDSLASFHTPLGNREGGMKCMRLKSEDLPVLVL